MVFFSIDDKQKNSEKSHGMFFFCFMYTTTQPFYNFFLLRCFANNACQLLRGRVTRALGARVTFSIQK